jgi:osmotically-inducible protein OsmY
MNTIKKLGVALTGVLLLSTVAVSASPGSSDAWIGTKGKIALLTTDGAGRTSVKMDTENGRVTLHGKVESQAVKDKAEATIRKIDGVTSVKNLIQVVPESMEKWVKATDKDVKERVEVTLKANKGFDNVHVDSVDNGVVLLSGKTATWVLHLEAIEAADRVAGARRVASLIETEEK